MHKNTLNNKGFAITSFLYSILVIFLVFLSLLLVNIINSKLTLNNFKNSIKDKIEDKNVENNYAELIIDEEFVEIAIGQNYNLLNGVYLEKYNGDIINSEINFDASSFNNETMGTYIVSYNTTYEGKTYNNHRIISVIPYKIPTEPYEFAYKNGEYTLLIETPGYYKLEVWGAQGGASSNNSSAAGGYGGYSKGTIYLDANTTLFINVGGKGVNGANNSSNKTGGYNGGGTKVSPDSDYYSASGGGATHIATTSGQLSSLSSYATVCQNSSATCPILIVAGGGGGGAGISGNYGAGGAGGGIKGNNGSNYLNNIGWGGGGTQTSGGCKTATTSNGLCGSFGKGDSTSSGHGGAGGGGFYGGGSTNGGNIGGGGGSGYIGNPQLKDKYMYCYNCSTTSTAESTLTYSTKNVDSSPISDYAKANDGYARITFISLE